MSDKPNVIIDNGTGYCKAGFSGEEGPRAVFPAIVGRPKNVAIMAGAENKAFERRFLFKVEYEKPSLEARKKIWGSKLPELGDEDLSRLADRFDFSGGEIDNIVRKCEMTEIIKGALPSYDEIAELCENEHLEKEEKECRVGFCLD